MNLKTDEIFVGDLLQYETRNVHSHYYDIEDIDNKNVKDFTWYSGSFLQVFIVVDIKKASNGHRAICLLDDQHEITWVHIRNLFYMKKINRDS